MYQFISESQEQRIFLGGGGGLVVGFIISRVSNLSRGSFCICPPDPSPSHSELSF